LRGLPLNQGQVTLSFDSIEHELEDVLPQSARDEPKWWGNQKQGTQVEILAWMDAGWLVDIVDLRQQWVCFVRQ